MTRAPTPRQERIEARALRSLFADLAEVLRAHGYDNLISNGGYCVSCRTSGMGTCEPHQPTCAGVLALQEVEGWFAPATDEDAT
jgi:hypothetical protein